MTTSPLEEMILDSVVESFALEASLEVSPAALQATSIHDVTLHLLACVTHLLHVPNCLSSFICFICPRTRGLRPSLAHTRIDPLAAEDRTAHLRADL